MGRSWKVATAFGIGIYVHWTFLLLPLLVLFFTWEGDPLASIFAVSLVLLIFGCVVLHELGHALMARHFGISTRDITLLPIGGIARLERMSEKPWEEFCIAVAGPAVNVVISGLGVLLILLLGLAYAPIGLGKMSAELAEHGFAACLLMGLVNLNVGLVIFNMIPAFPMDGGRVFRALLAAVIGHLRATEVAALVGMVFAGLISLGGLLVLGETYNPLPIVLGMFVLFAGQQELLAVRYREASRKAPLLDVLPADAPWPIPPSASPLYPFPPPPEANFSGFSWDRRMGVWIEWREGRPVHVCSGNGEWGRGHGE